MASISQPIFAIGIMSGTSADGIDGVILEVSDTFKIHHSVSLPYSDEIKKSIRKLSSQKITSMEESGSLNTELANCYSEAVSALLQQIDDKDISAKDIAVIGCHGQTIHHSPDSDPPFSLQIGDGKQLSNLTGYKVVNDFRSADIKAGGQGAPLVPAFHEAVFSSDDEHRAVINIGGISNITYLPAGKIDKVIGFDTGPGNTLIDYWCRTHFKCEYDHNGDIARGGDLQLDLLDLFLKDAYFERLPPKSTGQEYFNIAWLKDKMSLWEGHSHSSHTDILMTLTMLTARCIVDQLKVLQPPVETAYLCGGGVNNELLVNMINDLSSCNISTTDELGIEPQYVEAAAFAWMAYQTLQGLPSTLPSVTGANEPTIAGILHLPGSENGN